jgi:all-trans-retinol 13,14-reductase
VGYDEIRLPSGRIFKMAYGRDKLQARLTAAFPQEKEAIAVYLDKVEDALSNSAFLNLHKNRMPDITASVDTPDTLKEVLDAHFKSDEIKAILAISSFLHGTSLDKISFGQHSCIAGGLYNSAYEIEGGGKSITAAYEKALKDNGVDIFLKTKATEIREEGDKKIINTAGGQQFACDNCVCTIHPKEFLKIAPANVYREGYKARINALEETPGFFTLYAKYTGPKAHCTNIFLVSDLDLVNIFNPDMKKRSYYINFSHTEPQTVSIISLVPSSPQFWNANMPVYKERKESYAEFVKSDISRRVPEIAEHLEYLAVSTPATSNTYAGYYSGYGIMHDMHKTKILPMTKIKGLYLSGQSVIAPGLLGTVITSLIVDGLTEKV